MDKTKDETKIQVLTEKVDELRSTIQVQSEISKVYDAVSKTENAMTFQDIRLTSVEKDVEYLKEGMKDIKDCVKETNISLKSNSTTLVKLEANVDSFIKIYETVAPDAKKEIAAFKKTGQWAVGIIASTLIVIFGYMFVISKSDTAHQNTIIEMQEDLIKSIKERNENGVRAINRRGPRD